MEDLSVSDGNNKCVIDDIENKNSKKLLFTYFYRPSCGAIKRLKGFLENVFKENNTENKLCFVVGNLI